MLNICFYFQVHQPYRLRRYSFFDIGSKDYFDEHKNKEVLRKVARKCYLPTNRLMLSLLKKHPEFKISYSLSGIVLDQFERYCPEVLDSFKELVATGQVELLGETYYHSLSFLYSPSEFRKQVKLHDEKIKKLFGVKPTILRNTELIYNNDLAAEVENMGYKGILMEGADKVLGWRSPNFVYKSINTNIKLLTKNYSLSDDIAFRFSDKGWKEYPLDADKFSHWVNKIHGNGTNLNLFMDYETFGEHQWESTGIFSFLEYMPEALLKHKDNCFNFPSEVVAEHEPVAELDVPCFISWADTERDVSAWLGNDIQRSAIRKIYALENAITLLNDESITEDWRRLQTSDHFYYMCTKWFNDGDVHKYFNPYDSPYDGFIYFMNVFKDLQQRVDKQIFNLNSSN